MLKSGVALLVFVVAFALTEEWGNAQGKPKLGDYFTNLPQTVLDPGYFAEANRSTWTVDLNGDGQQDVVVLGNNPPGPGKTCCTPQPGRVFLGDGNGHFSRAPSASFPVDTLMTVTPRKVLFADFNADGHPDMFISAHGWDGQPAPGEQNRLYLSLPEGGWRDATENLPQQSDFSHTSAVGDLSGRGLTDIFVGNGYTGTSLIGPYTLLNTGSGQFTPTTADIPVARNQLLDPLTAHHFVGAELTDMDDDGLPDLVVTADASVPGNKFRHSTILWNRDGQFVQTDTTVLPEPGPFVNTHVDLDVKRIDINHDGLQDLVIVGTQGGTTGAPSYYDGWFVQILVNKGDRQFVDETTERLPQGGASGGSEGVVTGNPWAKWVRIIDFNQDGAPDFSVEYTEGVQLKTGQPLIWLNDGTGHFSTLKAQDFVGTGSTFDLGNGHLVATRNGYSFMTWWVNRPGGLTINGLLATKPYRLTTGTLAPAN